MAWYEEYGPNAEYVRGHIFMKLDKKYSFSPNEKNAIETILLKHIPDSKTDFGSYRGYASFGLEKEIWDAIKADIDSRKSALTILKDKFTRYVIHFLYKPNGYRMKECAETTLVGR
jgi:hypothetical protein